MFCLGLSLAFGGISLGLECCGIGLGLRPQNFGIGLGLAFGGLREGHKCAKTPTEGSMDVDVSVNCSRHSCSICG